MTLQELKYVVALAETGHFGQAAERCHVSQSTLSLGLKKLEDTLGVQLFDRSLKHVTPTGHGREIVAAARRILDEARRIEELARRSEDPMDRSLHFGVIPTLGPYYMPHVLALVHRLYPRLRLLLREEMTPQLLAHLADGRLDAGLLALPVDDPGLQVAPLFVEPFVAAVPSGHPLASAGDVGVEQLAGAGLLLLEEGHCLREQAMEACKMAGLRNEEIRATSLETLRQMVGMGLGVTLLPALAGGSPEGVGQLVAVKPLAAPGAARTIGLIWRRQSPLADTVAQLVATLRAHRPAVTRPPPSIDAVN